MKTKPRSGLPGALCLAVILPLINLHAAAPKASGSSSTKSRTDPAAETLRAELTIQPADLSPASTIEVIFPTPMIGKERIGTKEARSPLEITPALNGTFEWISTRSGIFRLGQPPKFNATYIFKLREGLQDATGRALSAGTLATARSAQFRMIDQHPKWFDADEAQRVPVFLFEFNADIAPDAAAGSISFVSQEPSRTVPAKVRHATGRDFQQRNAEPQPTWEEEIAKARPTLAADAPRRSALVVEPESPLPVAAQWQLRLAETLATPSGDLVAQGQELHLGDVSPFKVTTIEGHTPFDQPYYLDIEFNKDLIPRRDPQWQKEELEALAEKLARAVQLQPAPTGLKATILGRTLRLEGPFTLKQPYRITIDPAINSADGLSLQSVVEAETTFLPNPPYVAAPAFMRAQLAKGAGEFEFIAANVREVRVRVKRMTGPELLQAAEKYEGYRSAYYRQEKERKEFKPEPIDAYDGTIIYDRAFAVSKPLDQSEMLKVNWRDILGAEPAAPLFIEMEGRAAAGVAHEGIVTQTLVQFTDLGLMQKSNGKESLVFVTSLQTGQPVPAVRLTLVDEEHKLIGYGDTDANGIAVVKGANPAFVLAQKDGDCSVIQCRDSHIGGVIPYSIPTAWEDVWKPARKTFLFSDRPLYRPGDTGHFKAHTRLLMGDDLHLDGAPVKARLKLRDPRYRTVLDKEISFTTNGSWADDLQLPEGPTGWYNLSLMVGSGAEPDDEEREHHGSYSFRIDEYKPNTFEVKLDGTKIQIMPDRMKLPLSAQYYMGKALSRAKVNWHAHSVHEFTPPEGFSGYHFGDAPRWARYGKDRDADGYYDEGADADPGEWWVSGDLTLEEEGTATLEMPLPPPDRASLPQQVRVSAEVTDINQQTVSAATEIEVPGAQFMLGLGGPQLFGAAGREMRLEIIGIDADGRPAAENVRAEVKIERQEYHTLKIATAGGGTTTKDQVVLREEFKQEIPLTPLSAGTPPNITLAFTPWRGGSYFLSAEATDATGKKVLSRLPFYVIGGGEFPWAMEDGARINLQPEKVKLKPGEEAVIVVKTPIAGTALVSVERNRVHHHFIAQVSPDNPLIRVPVQDAEAPNVFVSVIVVRGSEASPKQHKMPEYKVGYCQLEVESKTKELTVAIVPDRAEVKPAEAVNVTATVTDYKGRPVSGGEVTLYAVDEGVLSLMKHQTPDPLGFFHAPFPLAIDNFTSFDDLLPEDLAARERGNKGFLIGGGSDDIDPTVMKVRKNFVATPLWLAAAMTDAQGKVAASFTTPDNLTRYRLMAVAVRGSDRFGSGEAALIINKPLMVEPVVPRFARLGDEVLLKAVLHNTTLHEGEVEVTLELDATADFIREPRFFVPVSLKMDAVPDAKLQKHTLTIKAGETTSAAFPVRFNALGTAKWRWTARTVTWSPGAPALDDATESTFEVTHPVPELREVRYVRLKGSEPQENLIAEMNPALLEGQGALLVSLSTSRLFEVRDALEYVLTYPYGCVEQVTSATVPWLALGGYQPLFPHLLALDKTKSAVQSGVNRLLQMTTDEGGLSYWPGGHESSLWGTAYGGLILIRAREAGAAVPPEVIDNLLAYLSKRLRGLENEHDHYIVTDSALALYTLAKGNKAEPAYQNLLHARRDRLPEAARLYAALAMTLSNTPEAQIKEMLGWRQPQPEKGAAAAKTKTTPAKKATVPPAPAPMWSHWAGNGANKGLRLIAYTHLGLTNDAEALAQSILQSRTGRGEWGNTFTNAWILTGLAAYERSLTTPAEPLLAKVVWGAQDVPLQITGPADSAQASFALPEELAAAPLRIEMPAQRQAFGRIDATSFPPNRDFSGENRGYAISRGYEKVLPDGGTAEAKDLRVGDMVVVTLAIEIDGGDRFLAIEDPLPSVLEAINPDFETQNARSGRHLPEGAAPWFCDYRELRSDRALFFTNYAPSKGKFALRYLTRVIAEGDTIAAPAKIEAMYEPSKYGLSPSQRLQTLPSAGGQVAGP